MDEREVRKERSGWRDPALGPWHHKHGFHYPAADPNDLDLNNRHRLWGYDCPAVDVDLPFLEYDNCFPIAFIDYKWRQSLTCPDPDRNTASNRALSELRTKKGQLPFYVVYYTKAPWTFRPVWINTQAKQLAPKNQCLTESGYVEWLYWLRDRTANEAIVNRLDNQVSWDIPLSPSTEAYRRMHKKRKILSPVPTLFDQNPPTQSALWEVPV